MMGDLPKRLQTKSRLPAPRINRCWNDIGLIRKGEVGVSISQSFEVSIQNVIDCGDSNKFELYESYQKYFCFVLEDLHGMI